MRNNPALLLLRRVSIFRTHSFRQKWRPGQLKNPGEYTFNIPNSTVYIPSSCFSLPVVHLNESISCSVVCDGEPQRILCLCHLHLLRLPSDMSEDEVFKSYLAPQKLLHVHFVRVEGAKQDLMGTRWVNISYMLNQFYLSIYWALRMTDFLFFYIQKYFKISLNLFLLTFTNLFAST